MQWWAALLTAIVIVLAFFNVTMRVMMFIAAFQTGAIRWRGFRRSHTYTRAGEPAGFRSLIALNVVTMLISFGLGAFLLSLFFR